MRQALASTSRAHVATLLALLAACGDDFVEPTSETATSVLVVSFDALRADALGTYGHPGGLSPRIDAFAAEGTVFEAVMGAAPVTPTSFASLFSGRPPWTSFRGWRFTVPAAETLAGRFGAVGHRTFAWLNNSQLTPERGFDRGFEAYHFFNSVPDRAVLDAFATDLPSLDTPFFAWLHFLDPHSPYDAHPAGQHLYDPSYEGPYHRTSTASFEPTTAPDRRRVRALYDGEVLAADALFGQVLDLLDATGLAARTVVVLTADHGEEFLERGGYQHRWLYEETVRVPLVLRSPRHPGGRRVERPVSHARLGDLLLALAAGGDLDAATPGDTPLTSVAMTDRTYRGVALRSGDLKLIRNCHPTPSSELYDLGSDPGELRDLAERQTSSRRRLEALLHRTLGGEPCRIVEDALRGADATDGLDPKTVERLEALGYAD